MNDIETRWMPSRKARPVEDEGARLPDRRSVPRHRLYIEMSPDLHRRVLSISALRRLPVNAIVREVLERAFPGT